MNAVAIKDDPIDSQFLHQGGVTGPRPGPCRLMRTALSDAISRGCDVQALVEGINDLSRAAILTDTNGAIIGLNKLAADVSATTVEYARGMAIEDFLYTPLDNTLRGYVRLLKIAREKQRSVIMRRVSIITLRGNLRAINLVITPVCDEAGAFVGGAIVAKVCSE